MPPVERRSLLFTGELRRLGVFAAVERFCLDRGFSDVALLVAPARGSRNVADARHLAMHLLRTRFNMSYPQIGAFFARDHTTVLLAVRKVERQAVPLSAVA